LAADDRTRRRAALRRGRRRRRLALLAAAIALAAGASVGAVVAADDGGPAGIPAEPAAVPPPVPVVETAPPELPRTAAAPGGVHAQEVEPQPAREIAVTAVGDITMGRTPVLPPGGAKTFFSRVARELRGDVVLGNLETTLTDATASQCGAGGRPNCFDFRVPPSYAKVLRRAGFTVLNLANNHSYDYFEEGRRDTVRALHRQGLRTTGRPGEITYVETGGVVVALVGFAPYEWAQDLRDLPAARRLVRKADRKADLVVVTMHAGAEGSGAEHVAPGTEVFLGEDRGDPVRFAHAAVDAGADLIVGHGPHVLRGMEWYRGRLVAYSLGNFSGWHTFGLGEATATSAILRVTLRPDGVWVKGRLVATRLIAPGLPAIDPARAAHERVRGLSRADFGRRAVKIGGDGRIRPPA
jgi:hypothetical protein